jgi:hypothetical protein
VSQHVLVSLGLAHEGNLVQSNTQALVQGSKWVAERFVVTTTGFEKVIQHVQS